MSEPALVFDCPGCKKKMITLVSSSSRTYSAALGNGETTHTIEWCEYCGTVRQFTGECGATRSLVKLPMFVLIPEVNKIMLKKINHEIEYISSRKKRKR